MLVTEDVQHHGQVLQLLLLLLRISPDALRSLLAILVQSDAHDEPITYHFLASILVLLG